jgi:hypothetical protein
LRQGARDCIDGTNNVSVATLQRASDEVQRGASEIELATADVKDGNW